MQRIHPRHRALFATSYSMLLPCALAATMALLGGNVHAQSAASSDTLEEIIVTAQKRAESLQTTPIAITALSQDTLARAGVKNFETLAKVAPEINVNSQNNGMVIAVRGVRANAFGPADESANAIHLDGAYLARFQGLAGLFYDLQRLEVAAGPQGTLYGRNATGGAINLITNKPTQEFGGHATLEGGTYSLLNAEAALNVPVTNTMALRFAGRHLKRDGYYKDSGLDDANQNSGRISMLWNMTDSQSLLVTGNLTKQTGKNIGANIIAEGPQRFSYTTPSGVVIAPSAGPASADGSHYVTAPAVIVSSDPRRNKVLVGDADHNFVNTTLKVISAQYDNDLGFATFTVLGSYFDLVNLYGSGTITGDIQPAFNPPAGFGNQNDNWKSLEMRLTSDAVEPVKWVVGLYGFKEDLSSANFGAYQTNAVNAAPTVVPPNPFTVSNPLIANNIRNNSADALAYAAFGEATWSVTNDLHLTAGLRYNVDEKEAVITTFGLGGVSPIPTFFGKDDWKETTWRFNALYDITDTNRVYVNAAEGYKSGGFAFGTHPLVQPEHIRAYEIGSKNEFLNNRLRVNAAAWYYKYKDYETTVLLCINEAVAACPQDPAQFGTFQPTNQAIGVVNAGGARTYGASLNVEALLFTADRFNASVQYLDAKYTDFNLAQIAYVVPNARRDYSGTQLGWTADWSGTASYTHVWNIGDANLDAQLAMQYSSERLLANVAQPGSNTYFISDPSTTLDFSLRYGPAAGHWDVTAYVNNLTDELVTTASQQVASPIPAANGNASYFTSNYGPPRTVGVIVGVRF